MSGGARPPLIFRRIESGSSPEPADCERPRSSAGALTQDCLAAGERRGGNDSVESPRQSAETCWGRSFRRKGDEIAQLVRRPALRRTIRSRRGEGSSPPPLPSSRSTRVGHVRPLDARRCRSLRRAVEAIAAPRPFGLRSDRRRDRRCRARSAQALAHLGALVGQPRDRLVIHAAPIPPLDVPLRGAPGGCGGHSPWPRHAPPISALAQPARRSWRGSSALRESVPRPDPAGAKPGAVSRWPASNR